MQVGGGGDIYSWRAQTLNFSDLLNLYGPWGLFFGVNFLDGKNALLSWVTFFKLHFSYLYQF